MLIVTDQLALFVHEDRVIRAPSDLCLQLPTRYWSTQCVASV